MFEDPRWKYIWTEKHQHWYEMLEDSRECKLTWYGHENPLGNVYVAYSPRFRNVVEVYDSTTRSSDPVLDRILDDLKKFLHEDPDVEMLGSYDKFRDKAKELRG